MSSFLHDARRLPGTFWVLVGATFVNRFGIFVWPFLTLIVTRRGNTAAEAGWTIMAYSVGSFIAAGLGGWLADRLGRNITMALSAFGGAVCMMALSQAESWQWLALVSFFTGLLNEAGHPAGNALLQDIVSAEQRVTAFAIQRWAINLGWSLGPATAGFLAERSFFWLFLIDALTSVFFGIVAWKFLPAGRKTEAHRAGWLTAWSSIRRNRAFLALAASCVCLAWVFRQSSTTFPLAFEHSGLPTRWLGLVLGLNGVMICLLEMPLTALTRQFPVRGMIALGYTLMGGSFLLLLGTGGIGMFLTCMVVFTLGEMFSFSRQQAYAASLAEDDMRGRYSGFTSFAWGLGGILSSAVGLQIYDWNANAAWWLTAALGLAAAAILVMGSRSRLHP